jgi:hypothetical protein
VLPAPTSPRPAASMIAVTATLRIVMIDSLLDPHFARVSPE